MAERELTSRGHFGTGPVPSARAVQSTPGTASSVITDADLAMPTHGGIKGLGQSAHFACMD